MVSEVGFWIIIPMYSVHEDAELSRRPSSYTCTTYMMLTICWFCWKISLLRNCHQGCIHLLWTHLFKERRTHVSRIPLVRWSAIVLIFCNKIVTWVHTKSLSQLHFFAYWMYINMARLPEEFRFPSRCCVRGLSFMCLRVACTTFDVSPKCPFFCFRLCDDKRDATKQVG